MIHFHMKNGQVLTVDALFRLFFFSKEGTIDIDGWRDKDHQVQDTIRFDELERIEFDREDK